MHSNSLRLNTHLQNTLQALPAAKRHQDPARHGRDQLLAFLRGFCESSGGSGGSGGCAEPAAAAALRRYAEWRAAVVADEAAARAAAPAPVTGGKGRPPREQQQATSTSGRGGGGGDSGEAAAIWRLVERTRAHPKFAARYRFPSWEEGWLRTRRAPPPPQQQQQGKQQQGKQQPPPPPRLLGIDCEMCATTESSSALLAVAVVDADGAVVMRVRCCRCRGFCLEPFSATSAHCATKQRSKRTKQSMPPPHQQQATTNNQQPT